VNALDGERKTPLDLAYSEAMRNLLSEAGAKRRRDL
jgi:hypothetical protein